MSAMEDRAGGAPEPLLECRVEESLMPLLARRVPFLGKVAGWEGLGVRPPSPRLRRVLSPILRLLSPNRRLLSPNLRLLSPIPRRLVLSSFMKRELLSSIPVLLSCILDMLPFNRWLLPFILLLLPATPLPTLPRRPLLRSFPDSRVDPRGFRCSRFSSTGKLFSSFSKESSLLLSSKGPKLLFAPKGSSSSSYNRREGSS